MKRTVIIGLDGVPFGLLDDLSAKGVMPTVGRLAQNGVFRKMTSSLPEISSVAWSSIITGKNPGEHGIFGFTDLRPGTRQLYFPNFLNLKAPPFWNDRDETMFIVNVPSTFPAKPMNGIHIAGFVSIDLKRTVHPQSLLPKLEKLDYRVDVESEKAHQSMELFLNDLDKTLDARIRIARELWSEDSWKLFMLVFTGTDRLMHFLWNAYEDQAHPHHEAFINHFRKIDAFIAEITATLDDDDDFLMLSDHGIEKLEIDVYVNHILKREKMLLFDSSKQTFATIHEKSLAFAMDPGRIYLNMKDKYPNGGLSKNDRETATEKIIDTFRQLEINGRPVIKNVYRKEELYHGPCADHAPDIVLLANHGFNLKGNIKTNNATEDSIFTGKHTYDDAFLLVNGEGAQERTPESPSVFDVTSLFN